MNKYDKIVISLTTIDSRLDLLKSVIVNLFEQTLKPNIIHIFYSHDPLFFDNGISNIVIAKLLEELDLINFFDIELIATPTENIGSYRKLIPALKIYKNDIIITIDDDHLFEPLFIQKYIDQYNINNCVVCSGGVFYPINNYSTETNCDHSSICSPTTSYADIFNLYYSDKSPPTIITNYIPQGFGGILYHTNMFDSDFIMYDYKSLPELVKKNDDIFFRNYTFKKNIKVVLLYIKKKHILDIENQQSLYFDFNINVKACDVLEDINKLNLYFVNRIDNKNIININDELLYFQIKNNIRETTRAEVKLLQYEEFVHVKSLNTINLCKLFEDHLFKKELHDNCIVINIEKDQARYNSALEELKKLSITQFVHLKATYWKETDNFIKDLNSILSFMKYFNPNIGPEEVTINEFSEISDKNIYIQDGPLACYCSHVRAMIYGYTHFEDYTIICEDDIFIANTALIEQYIQCVPDDWDIICLNSKALHNINDKPFYKFEQTFCSLHFYIIRNRCYQTIFKYLYPITDQIDILLANIRNKLNIYNIVDTVYQKNFSTNTQNNLNVILNTPGYESIRITIKKINELLISCINSQLPNNTDKVNTRIASSILFDVVFNYVFNNNEYPISLEECDDYVFDYADEIQSETKKTYLDLYEPMYLFVKSCVKGINIRKIVFSLIKDIQYIIECFSLHNTFFNFGEDIIKAYSYGSSSNVYTVENKNMIIKVFNKKLRWTHEEHNNYLDIFDKELLMLDKLGYSIFNQKDIMLICMLNYGESLYDNFILPSDWEQQMHDIFKLFDTKSINYPEFNLKNIIVSADLKITLIDFGLAKFIDKTNNDFNCDNFIELLKLLNGQFSSLESNEKKHVLYKIFVDNIKKNKDSKFKNNIF